MTSPPPSAPDAGALRCPGCGAPASDDRDRCAFCDAALALAACPSCFGRVFRGAAHCPHCGARAEREAVADPEPVRCPRCRDELRAARVGGTTLRECAGCGGLWLDREAFRRIRAGEEARAAVLADGLGAAAPLPHAPAEPGPVRYLPCPACAALMNRVNFARRSGIVVDVCREHGTWFDRDELRAVVEFIRGGGLEAARERERRMLEEERRLAEWRARQASSEAASPLRTQPLDGGPGAGSDPTGAALAAAVASLAKWLGF